VVEDHLLQRRRTEELLESERAFRVVHSCETLAEHVRWLRTQKVDQRPHLLVLDLIVDRGEDVDPERVAGLVQAGIHVLVLSALASPPLVRRVIRAGASGVVGKRDPEADIIAAVWSVLGRRKWMTPELAAVIAGDEQRPKLSEQEERALVLYASGLTLDAVAASLGVKRDTARTYLDRVRDKYAASGRTVRSKADLTRVALTDGYLAG
jgi:DNA-binding NarL/FixJ family response regulator